MTNLKISIALSILALSSVSSYFIGYEVKRPPEIGEATREEQRPQCWDVSIHRVKACCDPRTREVIYYNLDGGVTIADVRYGYACDSYGDAATKEEDGG